MTPLRIRMIEDMRTVGLASGTQALYLDAVRRLAAHYDRSPDELSEAEVRSWLLSLRERGLALGTFKTNQGGIRFLYRQTLDKDWALFGKKRIRLPKQRRLPVALPDNQIRALLSCIANPTHRTCFSLMYGCGLRIGEAAALEIGAIDRANMVLRIVGKGDKQRLVRIASPEMFSGVYPLPHLTCSPPIPDQRPSVADTVDVGRSQKARHVPTLG